MQQKIAWWKIATVMLLFPMIYQLYSISPLALGLFQESKSENFVPFFLGLTFLHWLTFYICYTIVKSSKWTNAMIGYQLSTNQTLKIVSTYFLIAFLLLILIEYILHVSTLNPEKVSQLGDFFPKDTTQRVVFIFTAFSAGFLEEYIYRGFAICSLESRGISRWIALIISSISFTLIHGVIVFQRFPAYFFPSLLFGALFIWKRQLQIPMLVHAFIDLTALLMILTALA